MCPPRHLNCIVLDHSAVKKFAAARDEKSKNSKKRKKDATDVKTVIEGEANSTGDTNRSKKKKTKTSGSSSSAVGLLNSEATSKILAMQHKTDKTFCADDMRKLVLSL